jgi:hypothetical protein
MKLEFGATMNERLHTLTENFKEQGLFKEDTFTAIIEGRGAWRIAVF